MASKLMVQALLKNGKIQYCNISCNRFNDGDSQIASILGRMVKINCCILHLDVSNCRLHIA